MLNQSRVLTPIVVANLPATAERLMHPAKVDEMLEGRTVEELGAFFRSARDLGARAWMSMAIAVGHAQASSDYGDGALDTLSQHFGLHRSRIARLGKIYREIIKPRIEESGDAATFPIGEQSFFEVACEAAPIVARSPVEILAEAEDAKAEDPRYSVRRMREDLGLVEDDTVAGDAKKTLALLVKLAATRDETVNAILREMDGEKEVVIRQVMDVVVRLLPLDTTNEVEEF